MRQTKKRRKRSKIHLPLIIHNNRSSVASNRNPFLRATAPNTHSLATHTHIHPVSGQCSAIRRSHHITTHPTCAVATFGPSNPSRPFPIPEAGEATFTSPIPVAAVYTLRYAKSRFGAQERVVFLLRVLVFFGLTARTVVRLCVCGGAME